jgi:1,4-dihydroxy-2-naphthoate octaprenyltransferase
MENIVSRSNFSLWLQAIRPFSLTATLIPVLFGALYTLAFYDGIVNWYLMFIIALGAPFFQLSGNLLSEYYDFKHKVDRPDTFGSSRILVDGLMKPRTIFFGGLTALFTILIFGALLTYFRGIDMLIIGLIGMGGSYFYTTSKYHALGDLHIFLLFGPLMSFGTVFALTGTYELMQNVLILSIPIGFLVTAILHANNTRDIKHDGEANIKTFASILGVKASIYYYDFLLLGSYLAVIIFILAGLVSVFALAVFITLPIALKNIKSMHKAKLEKPEEIAMQDVMTAQLHLLFGVLFSIGILTNLFLK